ncbi:MAG: ABC transporter ATP-binding protein/permease [Clostridia bacterium]|nr:ABC transporter ATP-binding protein/permease [Clostridia bacterium]
MLQLKNITKRYVMPGNVIMALDDVSVCFRKNEFVAILGPSGCGKTTMLNILGGLDRYTSGDLVINGTSTKLYADRDWDVYRNHRIGFVFQSYNLIPHQTILSNVELALTIAGFSKAERVEKAKKALDKVGLQGQYNKRPNQLSGGQMQRVAIARALVNDPDIILADEPTGALDTKTSVQVMDLLKEVASDRLVIMVTHNPELADAYANRTIRLLDGKVVADTNPYTAEECEKDVASAIEKRKQEEAKLSKKQRDEIKKKESKAKMSIFTAFRLSAQNLFSKKARTIMTAIAGAIGIIGVSLVLSISYGVQAYITAMQNDMLSGNPIKIEQTAYDISALTGSMTQEEKNNIVRQEGYVNVDSMVQRLINMSKTADTLMVENAITQDYVDYVNSIPKEHIADIHHDYGIDMTGSIYTNFTKLVEKQGGEEGEMEEKTTSMSIHAIRANYIEILEQTVFNKYAGYITSIVENFAQAPSSTEYIMQQYDFVGQNSRIASEKDEIMLVLDNNELVTDVLLAQLGYYTQEEFLHLICEADKEVDAEFMEHYGDKKYSKEIFSIDELLQREFVWFPNNVIYSGENVMKFGETVSVMGSYNPVRGDDWTVATDVENAGAEEGIKLKVVGILKPKAGVSYGCLKGGFYYTEELAKHAIATGMQSRIIDKMDDVITDPNDSAMSNIKYSIDVTYLGETKPYSDISLGESNLLASMGGMNLTTFSIQSLGGSNLPATISIYPKNFDHKQSVLNYLDKWNESKDVTFTVDGVEKTVARDQRENIIYSDILSLVIGMINQFIDIVTVALIGFTSLSLVVSTFMIAIITYVSVVERIKEIGVIRSLGGRKLDVALLFTAETAIIGLVSGLFGIGITYLASFIINIIVSTTTMITQIAVFPWFYALMMVGISVFLTLISGVFPAVAAAKKDPVIALRSE